VRGPIFCDCVFFEMRGGGGGGGRGSVLDANRS